MDLLRDRGAVEAACGGQCVCATCHVHVAPEWMAAVGEATGVEQELLDCSLERRPNSRLSCQILITEALDGLRFTVAPAEG
jgi:2Fe-2S ferredoxin